MSSESLNCGFRNSDFGIKTYLKQNKNSYGKERPERKNKKFCFEDN